jgi:nicotinamide mononucleotide (NMN) deamidase PncC
VGFKTEWPENVLLLFCRADSEAEAEENLRVASARALERIGSFVVARDDEQTPARLVKKLLERRETVAVVEGASGGYLSKLLTDDPAGDRCLASGLVASPRAMTALLMSATPRDLESTMEEDDEGWLCSGTTAERLAQTARDSVNTTYGLGITPFLGPAKGTERGESGRLWVALAGPSGVSHREVKLSGDRDQIRRRAAYEALAWLLAELS